MAGLLGNLNMADTDRPFTIVEGQEVVYRETELIFARWTEDMQAALELFVQEVTETFKERYKLPGSGYSQEEDTGGGAAPSAAIKASGYWETAYPLRQFGDTLSFDDIVLGYMTVKEFENHLQTVINRNNNLVFGLILKSLLNNASYAFQDTIHGSLTIQPLANQDGTTYPPVFGAVADAQAQNYLAPNYTEAQISDTNDPYALIRNTLEPHFGFPQGGSPIIALVNTSAVPASRLLTDFDQFTNRYILPGGNVSTLIDLPEAFQGGRIVGVCDGVVIIEWPRIPSGWILGMHLDAPRPLKQRKDPVSTGIPTGLQMVTKDMTHPWMNNRWRNRIGFGVGNRLNGVAVALNGTSSYSVPTIYQ
jgi:hypothetical protein